MTGPEHQAPQTGREMARWLFEQLDQATRPIAEKGNIRGVLTCLAGFITGRLVIAAADGFLPAPVERVVRGYLSMMIALLLAALIVYGSARMWRGRRA